jgi:hypothetical protein
MNADASDTNRAEARRERWFDLAFVMRPTQGVVLASRDQRDTGRGGECGCSILVTVTPVNGGFSTGRVYLFGIPSTPFAIDS